MAIVPRGFRDILPDEAEMREHVATTVRDRLKQHGYRPIETPLIESSTVGVDGARPSDTPFKLFDDNGDLLLVKPDNTTAVVRAIATRMSERDLPLRLRYEAPVVRQQPRGTARRRQFTQLGYELVGEGGDAADAEMVLIADEALAALGLESWQLLCSSVAPYQALLELGVDAQLATEALGLVHANDYIDLDALIADSDLPAPLKRAMCELPRITGGAKALDRVDALLRDAGATHSTTTELRSLVQRLAMRDAAICSRLSFDFSLMNSFGYYTGLVLKAYAGDLADPVGSGGRYDAVLDTALEQGAAAAGFAFSLERLTEALEAQADRAERAADNVDGVTASAPLRIAVPKGSLKDDTITMLNAVGIDADGLRDPGRHLIVPTRDARGGADGIGAVELVIVRVATKYPRIATSWYKRRGVHAEVVALHGNIELGPIVGMADRIVDITATGTTLRENDLVITGKLMTCTARFFANPGRARLDPRVRELARRLAAWRVEGTRDDDHRSEA